jgi:hypothetical protein
LPGGDVQSHGTRENAQAPAHSRHSTGLACAGRFFGTKRRGKEFGRVDLRPAGVE